MLDTQFERTDSRMKALSFKTSSAAALLVSLASGAQAEWTRGPGTLAWQQGTNVVWQLNFDRNAGKPFVHPITVKGGPSLTTAAPADHPWHYGLWFSWKYINGVNYWEQDRTTGRAEGTTRWAEPVIQTNSDGSATIQLELEYVHPSGRVELKESRRLHFSAPAADGSYSIDWTARFTAGQTLELGRTPMLGEPNGQVNGGYAGLSLRLAGSPLSPALVAETGAVAQFRENRARPDARALACNLTRSGAPAGAIAVLSDPANLPGSSPWYAVISEQMRFFCSAILAPKPLQLAAGETLALRYQVLVRATPWTPEELKARHEAWMKARPVAQR
jgi:hypothetical protein